MPIPKLQHKENRQKLGEKTKFCATKVRFVRSKEETMKNAKTLAEEEFLCSEAVLLALSKTLGVENNIIPRIATGFGGGIGRHGEICGALSGAIMGLGLHFGRDHPSETAEGKSPYDYSHTMVNRFIARFRHIRCKDILGVDISSEEGVKQYRQDKLWESKCRDIIQIAAGLAYDVLDANNPD
jgi:C_GCAxxG_C_C family probable redox protein